MKRIKHLEAMLYESLSYSISFNKSTFRNLEPYPLEFSIGDCVLGELQPDSLHSWANFLAQ